MKSKIKYLAIGLIVGIALTITTPVMAENIIKQIDVIFNSVNVNVNGKELEADNILYNGTTYIPIRNVAEILDKDIVWEQNTMTVNINDKSSDNFNKTEYQNFMKMFDLKKDMSATLSSKTYFYYEFIYNGHLNDEDFNKWLSVYKGDLSSYIEIAYNELGTYGVLNTITEFNRTADNGNKYNLGIAINDSNGFVVEIK